MNKITSRALDGFKYVYLVVFFALLAGLFHTLITDDIFDEMVLGVIVLFMGLAGGVLLYKTATSKNNRAIFLGIGFALIGLSACCIYILTGRA